MPVCGGDVPLFMLDEDGVLRPGLEDVGRLLNFVLDEMPPCADYQEASDKSTLHSAEAVMKGPANENWAFIVAAVISRLSMPSWVMQVDLALDDVLPCGESEIGYVACLPGAPPVLSGEDVIVVGVATRGAIMDAGPGELQELAVVFDGDGDPGTGWVPDPAFPNDFFQGMDRWYVAKNDGQGAWSLEVTDADGSTATPATSAARLAIRGASFMLVVPASEFPMGCPQGWRVTTFGHNGDYGLQPPNYWTGDVEPPLQDSSAFPAFPACP